MALGFYEGYVSVVVKRVENPDRNTATQTFTEAGVETWLLDNSSEWLPVWNVTKEVVATDANKFPFMGRKNSFLNENPAARVFCGMSPERNYTLKLLGHFLNQDVESSSRSRANGRSACRRMRNCCSRRQKKRAKNQKAKHIHTYTYTHIHIYTTRRPTQGPLVFVMQLFLYRCILGFLPFIVGEPELTL